MTATATVNDAWAVCPSCNYERPAEITDGTLVVREHRRWNASISAMIGCAGSNQPGEPAGDLPDDADEMSAEPASEAVAEPGISELRKILADSGERLMKTRGEETWSIVSADQTVIAKSADLAEVHEQAADLAAA